MAAPRSWAAIARGNAPASTAAPAGSALLGAPAVVAGPPLVAGAASAAVDDGFEVVGKAKSDAAANRIVVRESRRAYDLAIAQLQAWYKYQQTNSAAILAEESPGPGKELVKCCWAYVDKQGKVVTVEAFNRPSQEERKAVAGAHAAAAGSAPAKATICAEDVLFQSHPKLAKWTICSIAFSFTLGKQKPACCTQNGGCKKRLKAAGIHEPQIA